MTTPEPYYNRGGITIYHGDALDVLPTLKGIGAVITDPPYSSGGAFRSDRSQKTTVKYSVKRTMGETIAPALPEFSGDSRDQRGYLAWCSLWLTAAMHASVSGAPLAVFTGWRQLPVVSDAVQAGGYNWRGVVCWDKGNARPQSHSISFAAQIEFVVWGTKGPRARTEETIHIPGVFRQPSIKGEDRVHIAQKPDAVMRWLMRIAPPGATVLDPFMGSGATLRAAKDLGHPAIGIEADEHSCEVAVEQLRQGVLL